MIEILKNSLNERGGGLLIILTVMILAISGSYKLLTDDLGRISKDVSINTKELYKRSEILHDLDKRITILEVSNDY